jgi:hypothetical protein
MQENEFVIDSTVVPGIALNNGLTVFDYRKAPQDIPHWLINDNVCQPARNGKMWEIPIFSYRTRLIDRVFRKISKKPYTRKPEGCYGSLPAVQKIKKDHWLSRLFRSGPYLMTDFCYMTACEMCKAVKIAQKKYSKYRSFPLVMIGHPKTFANEIELSKFFETCCSTLKKSVSFGTFTDWINTIETHNDEVY